MKSQFVPVVVTSLMRGWGLDFRARFEGWILGFQPSSCVFLSFKLLGQRGCITSRRSQAAETEGTVLVLLLAGQDSRISWLQCPDGGIGLQMVPSTEQRGFDPLWLVQGAWAEPGVEKSLSGCVWVLSADTGKVQSIFSQRQPEFQWAGDANCGGCSSSWTRRTFLLWAVDNYLMTE